MASSNTFEALGVTFEVRRLPVDEACAGLDLLQGEEGFKKFSALLKLFAPVARVSRQSNGTFATGGPMVDLKTFQQDCFAGRLDLLVAFIAGATNAEYGGFLARAGVDPAVLQALPPTS